MPFAPSERLALLLDSGLFDAAWYRRTHGDLDMQGMEPADHYLTRGFRMNLDPGPDVCTEFLRVAHALAEEDEPVTQLALMARQSGAPVRPHRNRILYAAARAARRHGHDRAIRLAEAHLPEDLAHTVLPLRANAAAAAGDAAAWSVHVNAYLAPFGVAPIVLEGEGTIFDRLACPALPGVTGGPLVSVIMPAWNAAATLRKAAGSILAQTWRNLELLIVDDVSTDGTWAIMQEIAAQDRRVRILRNRVNTGPYVAKNIALTQARGDWITGHDADDWAHPQRIERHLAETLATGADASLIYWLRMRPDGQFQQIRPISPGSFDGVARVAAIACLFRTDVLRTRLGFWDSVRFGADSEMLDRAEGVLGEQFRTFRQFGLIGQDIDTSLTNDPVHGTRDGGVSPSRAAYLESYGDWHVRNLRPETGFLPLLQPVRRFAAPPEMVVPVEDVAANLPRDAGPRDAGG
jgi:hypothetical protein